jgi:hypothetical protein
MKHEDLLFYDIETFAFDSLIVFKDINNNLVAFFWSNPERGRAEYEGRQGVSDIKPTGFEDVGLDSEQPYKFMYRGILYIMHNGVIYNTTGQQLNTMDK